MYVFIDDSGDPGTALDRGSSRFFVLSAVCFDDSETADFVRHQLIQLKASFGWSQSQEFKSSKMKYQLIERVLLGIDFANVQVLAMFVDKRTLTAESKESFGLTTALAKYLESLAPSLSDAVVKFDGSGSAQHKRMLRRIALDSAGGGAKSFSLQRSHGEPLMQLADLTAGVLRKGLESDSGQPYLLLASRVMTHKDSLFEQLVK